MEKCERENSRLAFKFHAHAKRSRCAPVWMEYRPNAVPGVIQYLLQSQHQFKLLHINRCNF